MDHNFKIKKGLSLIKVMVVIAIIAVMGFSHGQAMAGVQGDKIWSATPVLATAALGTSGGPLYSRGVAFPFDNNSQFVIYYIDATGNTAGDSIDVYGYVAGNTVYQTTTLAFCGGNTNYIHANNAMQAYSGASIFAIDDGAGNVGWGEFLDDAGTGTGDIIEIHTGASNMGCAAANNPDLSGVTFAAGSRVYPLFKIGAMVIQTANTAQSKTSDKGLFAGTKNGPVVVHNADSTTGVTIHAVTGGYE